MKKGGTMLMKKRNAWGFHLGSVGRLLAGGAVVLMASSALASPVSVSMAPQDRPALQTRKASSSILMRVVRIEHRLVAVGERGIIVISDDNGSTWRQAKVPVSITLTSVTFTTPKKGWAVGHAGVVLSTEDGGETWIRKLDGRMVADLIFRDAAKNLEQMPGNEAASKLLERAKRIVEEGPDKPFFDVYFMGEQTGFIIGAYGLILRTDDGGTSWLPWSSHITGPVDQHLYAVRAAGKDVYIVGERGLFLRSNDGGNEFNSVPTSYGGSFFAVSPDGQGGVVVGGLRGTVLRSQDQGNSFAKILVPASSPIIAASVLKDGKVLLVNQAGKAFRLAEGEHEASPWLSVGSDAFSLVEVGGGSFVAAGVKGVTVIAKNAAVVR